MQLNLFRRHLASLSIALAAAAPAAFAAPTTLIYINSSDGTLYSYDSGAAYAESLIATGTNAFSISSGPLANTLYMQVGSGALATYNLLTNTQTTIGGAVPGNTLGEGRDGFLYAGSGTGLHRVNAGTGASALIGNGAFSYAGDLAVDPTDLDDMYGAVISGGEVQLASINKATGAQTLIGSFGLGSAGIFGLGFSLDGTLYAAGPVGGGGGGLYTVDKTTGAAMLVRSLGYNPYDMATQPFERDEPSVVPEPASLALVGLALLAAGGASRRRAR